MDIGDPIHYAAVPTGAPVYASDGTQVGHVEAILDNYSEHIFDGVVFVDREGELRFVDAPEVQRTGDRGVLLAIGVEETQQLGPPDKGHPSYRPNLGAGKLRRMLGGGWKRR
jgi:hypothetical protein